MEVYKVIGLVITSHDFKERMQQRTYLILPANISIQVLKWLESIPINNIYNILTKASLYQVADQTKLTSIMKCHYMIVLHQGLGMVRYKGMRF